MKFHKILLALCCLQVSAFAENDEMDIIAYWGVPTAQTSEANFKTFSDCGFTVSIYPYNSLQSLLHACRTAHRCGVKVLGQCPEMFDNPEATAITLKQEPGFFGYYLQDEPTISEIPQLKRTAKRLYATDTIHPLYVNLLPYHGAHYGTEAVRKVPAYQKYLAAATAIGCQQISFDHYPVMKNGLRPTWYHNLEMVRSESLASGRPFWGFVLSVPHDDYPQPTLATLRLQAYSNLAYGAQAIQYFTYWTPDNTHHDFHDAPISANGKMTKTYALVKRMNQELKTVSRLFYGARVTSVNHLGTVAQGTRRLAGMPTNIEKISVSGHKGAVVSQFQKNGHSYLAIINKNHLSSIRFYITPRNEIPCHLTKELKEEDLKTSYQIAAGDILLFRLQ